MKAEGKGWDFRVIKQKVKNAPSFAIQSQLSLVIEPEGFLLVPLIGAST